MVDDPDRTLPVRHHALPDEEEQELLPGSGEATVPDTVSDDSEVVIGPPLSHPNHAYAATDRTLQMKSGGTGADPFIDPLAPRMRNSADRYRDHSEIGVGGIGAVRACTDPNLGRQVAMKILHTRLQDDPEQRIRFMREARIMAQIEHPNILPVHELGMREGNGAIYFTMKKVNGRTLKHVLDALRANDAAVEEEYPLARLLDVFLDVCQGVAFAHSRQIIHRDLKPSNVLIGAFGEVLVLDWGMAKVLPGGSTGLEEESPAEEPRITADHTGLSADLNLTLEGSVSGTPLYMSPEQACGMVSELTQRSDIYSLGVILYELLTLKRSVNGKTVPEILERIVKGDIVWPRERTPNRQIPRELDAICRKAMARRSGERYSTVSDLIDDIEAYRLGHSVSVHQEPFWTRMWKMCKRHPVISGTLSGGVGMAVLTLLAVVIGFWQRSELLLLRGDRYRAEGNRLSKEMVATWKELDELQRGRFDKQPTEEEVRLNARLNELRQLVENQYQLAVILYVDAGETFRKAARNAALSEILFNRLKFAIMQREWSEAEKMLEFIRLRFGQNFENVDGADREQLKMLADVVRGIGSLQVVSEPAGARCVLSRMVEGEDGVTTPQDAQELGETPIQRLHLEKGSYMLTLEYPGRPAVLFPLMIDHGESEVANIAIPLAVPAGSVYVAAGNFYMGGEAARHNRLHQRFVDGFFMAQNEVTFGQYLEFWMSLTDEGERRQHMSRMQFSREDRQYINAWDDSGRLISQLSPDFPVVGITKDSADAYCGWLSRRVGREVRLPTEEEWEKAARGADGREYVWGEHYEDTFAFILENQQAHETYGSWASAGQFPVDTSVYGVHDMSGNVREWTSSLFPGNSPYYVIKGASASLTRRFLSCSYSSDTPVVPSDVGFRVAMPTVAADFGTSVAPTASPTSATDASVAPPTPAETSAPTAVP